MSTSIPIEELRKISYLNVESLGDRTVNLMPLWDGEQWHLWVPGPGGLFEVKPVDAVEGDYVARHPAHESDLSIPFVELMWQRASFPEICPFINAICDDFHNMGTSAAKLRHFFDIRDTLKGRYAARFAATELEYLIILCRTVFDLLQEAVAKIWQNRVSLINPELEKRRKSRKLPDTFSAMIFHEKQSLRTVEDIETRFTLPRQIASAYVNCGPFFASLRATRDHIVHGGSGVGVVFVTEKGFCVSKDSAPFASFLGWDSSHEYGNNLVSIVPWVAHLIARTIDACNAIVLAVASEILFPPEIAPGYQVFVRGPSTSALWDILRVYNGGSPWWGEEIQSAQRAAALDRQETAPASQ